mmetsp:Transcript_17613/g.28943  ORF Transcript_17613/g.28943 Transcript_17613/m.28943 type:complete len:221 (+) Transcript_17613:1285-1947(+)
MVSSMNLSISIVLSLFAFSCNWRHSALSLANALVRKSCIWISVPFMALSSLSSAALISSSTRARMLSFSACTNCTCASSLRFCADCFSFSISCSIKGCSDAVWNLRVFIWLLIWDCDMVWCQAGIIVTTVTSTTKMIKAARAHNMVDVLFVIHISACCRAASGAACSVSLSVICPGRPRPSVSSFVVMTGFLISSECITVTEALGLRRIKSTGFLFDRAL